LTKRGTHTVREGHEKRVPGGRLAISRKRENRGEGRLGGEEKDDEEKRDDQNKTGTRSHR